MLFRQSAKGSLSNVVRSEGREGLHHIDKEGKSGPRTGRRTRVAP